MPLDMSRMLGEWPTSSAEEAAAPVGRLLEAIHTTLPAGNARELFLTLVSERLQQLRCRPVLGPTWVYFSHLRVGECFLDPQGRALRKIEPRARQSSGETFTPPDVAVDLLTNEPVFVRANLRVERIDPHTVENGTELDSVQ